MVATVITSLICLWEFGIKGKRFTLLASTAILAVLAFGALPDACVAVGWTAVGVVVYLWYGRKHSRVGAALNGGGADGKTTPATSAIHSFRLMNSPPGCHSISLGNARGYENDLVNLRAGAAGLRGRAFAQG